MRKSLRGFKTVLAILLIVALFTVPQIAMSNSGGNGGGNDGNQGGNGGNGGSGGNGGNGGDSTSTSTSSASATASSTASSGAASSLNATFERAFTDVATVQGELPRPFQGRVEVIGEDKIGETWSQKGEGLDFKPDYIKVIFWSTKSQVVKQLDKDRFSTWPAHIQYADAQGSIAAKYGNLYKKYGDKVVVKVELHDGWVGYGVSPSTTASANPSGNTAAMAGGFLSFAGGQSMAFVTIVYYLIK